MKSNFTLIFVKILFKVLFRTSLEGRFYSFGKFSRSPALQVKNSPAMWRPGFDLYVGKIPWRRERLPTSVV